MKNVISQLASGKIGEIQNNVQKYRIRENTQLFNMLLIHLQNERDLSDFVDPFEMCSKTFNIYKKQAITFNRLGVESLTKYDTYMVKLICMQTNEIFKSFRPKLLKTKLNSLDVFALLTTLMELKTTIPKANLDDENKFSFTHKKLNFLEVIKQIIAINKLYKLSKKPNEDLRLFLRRNSCIELICQLDEANSKMSTDIHMPKEGDFNRKYFYALRTLIVSAIEIQRMHYRGGDVNIANVDLSNHIWVDRLMSTILEN